MSLNEVSVFLRKLEAAPLHQKTKSATKLLLYTLQRPNEVLGIKADELDFKNRVWVIPKERTKNGRTHLVPLSETTLSIMNELIEATGKDSYLFSSERGEDHYASAVLSRAISRNLEHFELHTIYAAPDQHCWLHLKFHDLIGKEFSTTPTIASGPYMTSTIISMRRKRC